MELLSDEKLSVVNVLHAYSSLPYQIVRDGGLMVYVDILTWFKSFGDFLLAYHMHMVQLFIIRAPPQKVVAAL